MFQRKVQKHCVKVHIYHKNTHFGHKMYLSPKKYTKVINEHILVINVIIHYDSHCHNVHGMTPGYSHLKVLKFDIKCVVVADGSPQNLNRFFPYYAFCELWLSQLFIV